MAYYKEFRIPLSSEDVIDVSLRKRDGRITAFSCNYRALIAGEWKEVVRYDTAHGSLHIHQFWLPKAKQVRRLEKVVSPKGKRDYAAALTAAERDLSANWARYRRNVEE